MANVQPFGVDKHPQRQLIIDALLAGESAKSISARIKPRLSHVSIWRYWSVKIKPALSENTKLAKIMQEKGLLAPNTTTTELGQAIQEVTGVAVKADPILSHVERRYESYERIKGKAEKKEDLRAWASVDSAETRNLELHARLTGRLQDQAAAGIQVLIVAPEVALAAIPAIPRISEPQEPLGDVLDIEEVKET